MSQQDILIALDADHDPGNEVGPCYDGPRDQPIWALSLVGETEDEDWDIKIIEDGLTYDAALEKARELAASGSYTWPPIGPANWPEG